MTNPHFDAVLQAQIKRTDFKRHVHGPNELRSVEDDEVLSIFRSMTAQRAKELAQQALSEAVTRLQDQAQNRPV